MPGEGRDARVVALLCAMTKDRALVVLGLSSKMRTKVRELEAAKVHGSVADKRAELAEVRAALLRRTNNASSSRCNTFKGKQSNGHCKFTHVVRKPEAVAKAEERLRTRMHEVEMEDEMAS